MNPKKLWDAVGDGVALPVVVATLATSFGDGLRKIAAAFFPLVPKHPNEWQPLFGPKTMRGHSSTC